MKLRRLSRLGLRTLAERRWRSILTAGGVVLGVALFVGALLTTVSSLQGFDRFVDEASGQADVVITPAGAALGSLLQPEAGAVPAGVAEDLAGIDGVAGAAGVVAFPTAVRTDRGTAIEQELNRRAPAAVVGAALESQTVYPVSLAAGQLPAPGAREVVVPSPMARSLDIGPGDVLHVAAPVGPLEVTITGVLEERGVGRLRTVVFTSIEAARAMGGLADGYTQVGIKLDRGIDVPAWVARHRAGVPGGVELIEAARPLRAFRSQIAMLNGALVVSAAGILFCGGFLIYLTLAMSVAERTRLYGILQSLGATRRQVHRLVVVEALVLGSAATAVGIVLGVVVARGLAAATERLLSLFGSPPLVISWWALGAGAVVGIVTTVVAALVPARRAARVDPVTAIREAQLPEPNTTGRWFVGAILLSLGASLLALTSGLAMAAAIVVIAVGSIQLMPFVIRPLAAALRPVMGKLSRGVGDIAVLHLARERSRSAYTLALVMLVMAFTIATAAVTGSYTRSLERELDRTLGSDLQLSAASTFPPAFLDALGAHPDVEAFTAIANASTTLTHGDTDERVYVQAIDPTSYFEVGSFSWSDGDDASARQALEGGGVVIFPTSAADRLGVERGDTVVMHTADGPAEFVVAGLAHLSNIPTRLVIAKADGERLFGTWGPDEAWVNVSGTRDLEAARRSLEDDLRPMAGFIASTPSEIKEDVRAQVAGGANGFYVLIFMAGAVGLFGLANTVAVSILQRYREIGLIRALGARRRQVRSMALVEAVTLVVAAFVLAVPLGALLSRPLLAAVQSNLGDVTVHYSFPWLVLPVVGVAGLVVGALAAALPARRAAALEIDDALRFE